MENKLIKRALCQQKGSSETFLQSQHLPEDMWIMMDQNWAMIIYYSSSLKEKWFF